MPSLSLTAYKALVRNADSGPQTQHPDRPAGRLVWAVAQNEAAVRGLIYLADRLRQTHGPCSFVITCSAKLVELDLGAGIFIAPEPAETQAAADGFLAHWQPDVCLWSGGNLRPILIASAKQRAMPMLFLNADEGYLGQAVLRWVPSIARETLAAFDTITALNTETRHLLRKMAGTRREVAVTGPLQIAAPALDVNESVHGELIEVLASRPVWLAAKVRREELAEVLDAHRASVRVTHRLMLILVAADFAVSLDARQMLEAQGWRVCHWEDGEVVDENTQVILVEEPEEMGLWYRISPISFLASSLASGYGGCDPYAPAALGSAIIYGPSVGSHLSAYSRLATVGAARIVKDSNGLAREIQRLLAADQAALMAHAAWQIISDGAEVTDHAIELLQECLDGAQDQS